MDVMPFDELNKFEDGLSIHFNAEGKIASKQDAEDIIDEMFELLLLAYATGNAVVNRDMGSNIEPTLEDVLAVVDLEIEGKTWRDRVMDYYETGGDMYDIRRIAETETHRDANAAAYATAVKAGATTKIWNTMRDDRVRDTHSYLQGVSAPMDGSFYSFKGGSTLYPGQWGIAEEDCNCRCYLTFR